MLVILMGYISRLIIFKKLILNFWFKLGIGKSSIFKVNLIVESLWDDEITSHAEFAAEIAWQQGSLTYLKHLNYIFIKEYV